ncbi:60S acidic ribosomal protein [Schistosoma japonicum]|uniref:Large ribosomal subunit protein P2 n=1 Tax=Schistosoma japonicum TaxID=6182 RepID=Q5DBM5_SCHJA|nr:SJCHGC01207 protein [Schistosoma japonicum]KAH8875966.1 60S acidic ribosomal protein P2 [Schistosoma japonicum]TNN12222.1 60S acidic ribosomal protein [Schistosoma japonicum]CAX72125.1 ribosomal protein, large P2 [Schistosoma japonicum]CAX78977.1 ribosomal protein, large P2 [Schistosoma japonicum]
MRYLAAFLLCQLGGKEKPTENDIKTVLNSVGIEHDSERLTKLLASLSGKDIPQLIAEGSQKLSSVPTAGAAVSAPSSAPTAPAKAEVPKAESKPAKTEVKEESESEEDMGFGLFD